jgi:methionyl-tRNA formyltransferase
VWDSSGGQSNVKVLLLRANDLRHQALGSILSDNGILAAEVIEAKPKSADSQASSLIAHHQKGRQQSETDFFKFYSPPSTEKPKIYVAPGDLNSDLVLKFVETIKFDLAITFGVSILRNTLIEKLNNTVLGIHLGLSPYYRGSGTNFFPFVNSELSAIGYTLMHLNPQIDKGAIVHQGRAPIVLGDSIHTIGNRNIAQMFDDIILLLRGGINFTDAVTITNPDGRFYQRKDFTEEALKAAYNNLESGLVRNFLVNSEQLLLDFPIIENHKLRVSAL